MHTYIHTYVTYKQTNKHTYIHTYIHTHTYLPTYLPTYIHTYIHTYTHIYIYRNTHACIMCPQKDAYTLSHAKPKHPRSIHFILLGWLPNLPRHTEKEVIMPSDAPETRFQGSFLRKHWPATRLLGNTLLPPCHACFNKDGEDGPLQLLGKNQKNHGSGLWSWLTAGLLQVPMPKRIYSNRINSWARFLQNLTSVQPHVIP